LTASTVFRPAQRPNPWLVAALLCAAIAAFAQAWLRDIAPAALSNLVPIAAVGLGYALAIRAKTGDCAPAPQPLIADENSATRAASTLPDDAAERGREIVSFDRGESDDGANVTQATASLDDGIETAAAWTAEDLAAFRTFADFASRQLQSVVATTENVVNSISSNMSDTDCRISKLIGFLRQCASEDEVGRAMKEIEAQIEGCRKLIEGFSERQREDALQGANQRAKVAAETAAVLKSLKGVDQIARMTTIMSLNVSIEAARTGAAGKGFMVIGREIRELAASTQALAAEVGERIEALLRAVNVDLENEGKRRELIEREAFEEVSRTLGAFSQNVYAIVRHERKVLDEVEHEEQGISDSILDAIGRLQFQDIIRQQLEQLEQTFVMVDGHMANLGAALAERRTPSLDESLWAKLEGQFETYHMEDQRVSHRAALGQPTKLATAPKIELF